MRASLVLGAAVSAASLAAAPFSARDDAVRARVHLVRLSDGAVQPQVAVDSRNVVHVVYFKGESLHGDLFHATLDRNGALSRPVPVNSRPGSAVAAGTMRGAHIAIGRNDRVHVAWLGSDRAKAGAESDITPVLYARMSADGQRFETERNVRQFTAFLDGGSIAADRSGRVYVTWHGGQTGMAGEADRNVWITESHDDGQTFGREAPAAASSTGACGCCGLGALADRAGSLFVLYRSASQKVHRDARLLFSRDHGATYSNATLQEWNIDACPMSTFALAETSERVLAAWETAGQVHWTRINPQTGQASATMAAPGVATNRKHPAIAGNANGETILVWAEDTGWNKGGSLAWQVFDRNGQPAGDRGRQPGVPVWSLAAVAAQPDGTFVVVY